MVPKLSDKDGNTINPANVETQREIRDGINNLLEGPGSDASTYSCQKLTIDGESHAQGVAYACKLVRIHFSSQNSVYLSINQDGVDADDNDFLLPSGAIIGPLPICDAAHLKFYGTAGDTVYLLLSK